MNSSHTVLLSFLFLSLVAWVALAASGSSATLQSEAALVEGMATSGDCRIAERGHITLTVHDVDGRFVRKLVGDTPSLRAGGFAAAWDGWNDRSRVGSALVFTRLLAKNISLKNVVMLN